MSKNEKNQKADAKKGADKGKAATEKALKEIDETQEVEVLEGSSNFEASYTFGDVEVPLGDLVSKAAEGLSVEEWNALPQSEKDVAIQAILDGLQSKEGSEEDKEEKESSKDKGQATAAANKRKKGVPKNAIYAKSFPAGTFPGDNMAAQRDLCSEAGRHLLAEGEWETHALKKKDGTTVYYIMKG